MITKLIRSYLDATFVRIAARAAGYDDDDSSLGC